MRCNRRNLWICGLAIVLKSGLQPAFAQENDQAAEAEKYIKYATPGEPHKQLQRLVGSWKTSSKSYFPDPENPVVTKGKATFTSIIGGRFVQQKFTGNFEGQDFEGMGIIGYDNAKQKYVGTWVDSMGTGMMRTEGKYDVKNNTLTETGLSSSPDGDVKMKLVHNYTSNDEFLTTISVIEGGREVKVLDITYTRVKDAKE